MKKAIKNREETMRNRSNQKLGSAERSGKRRYPDGKERLHPASVWHAVAELERDVLKTALSAGKWHASRAHLRFDHGAIFSYRVT